MEGFFLVYKPQFVTSHDVVLQIKNKFGFLKVGHSGILDPLAEGLLIILVEKATKLAFLFNDLDKKYEGIILFNYQYDTLDITGNLLDVKYNVLQDSTINQIFYQFHNKSYLQKPPMYSAIKINGQRMYHLARKNLQVDIPKRKVCIYSLKKISNLSDNQVSFVAHVSKGTYIRSLVSDIASAMNTYGVLKKLIRIAIGNYSLQDAKSFQQLTLNDLISVRTLFAHCQELILNNYLIKLVKNGIYLDHRHIITCKPFIVKDQTLRWIAYYELFDYHRYIPKYFF